VIENKGDLPILVCAGTIVKGGQQDRQISQDFVIPAAEIVPVDAFCVEQSRWTNERIGNATAGKFVVENQIAMPRLRASAQYLNDQGQVWEGVASMKVASTQAYQKALGKLVLIEEAGGLNARAVNGSSSLAVVLDAGEELVGEELTARIDAVMGHLAGCRQRGHLVGFAYAVDGQVRNVRTFAHPQLFARQEEAFVRTMSTEAFLAEHAREEGAAPPPTVEAADVLALIREIEKAGEKLTETAGQNDNGYRVSDQGYNANCYLPLPNGKRVALTRDWTRK
jgi:hypothetical protein